MNKEKTLGQTSLLMVCLHKFHLCFFFPPIYPLILFLTAFINNNFKLSSPSFCTQQKKTSPFVLYSLVSWVSCILVILLSEFQKWVFLKNFINSFIFIKVSIQQNKSELCFNERWRWSDSSLLFFCAWGQMLFCRKTLACYLPFFHC